MYNADNKKSVLLAHAVLYRNPVYSTVSATTKTGCSFVHLVLYLLDCALIETTSTSKLNFVQRRKFIDLSNTDHSCVLFSQKVMN